MRVKLGEWEKMGDEIGLLIDDPARLEALSQHGQKKAMNEYDWSVVSGGYAKMFTELIGRK